MQAELGTPALSACGNAAGVRTLLLLPLPWHHFFFPSVPFMLVLLITRYCGFSVLLRKILPAQTEVLPAVLSGSDRCL